MSETLQDINSKVIDATGRLKAMLEARAKNPKDISGEKGSICDGPNTWFPTFSNPELLVKWVCRPSKEALQAIVDDMLSTTHNVMQTLVFEGLMKALMWVLAHHVEMGDYEHATVTDYVNVNTDLLTGAIETLPIMMQAISSREWGAKKIWESMAAELADENEIVMPTPETASTGSTKQENENE